MSPKQQPHTMRTLALKLGLSTMTVSRALRNAPGVSTATRKRVTAVARSLGYRPDPALAVLNAYRHRRCRRTPAEQIAFLTNFPTPDGWKDSFTFVRYFTGVQRRAQQLGYEVEHFWVGDPTVTPRRNSQILRSRGIQGLIVGPLALGRTTLALDWDSFSTVAVGRSLAAPEMTTVSTNHFQAVELAWQQARRCGRERIGLILTEGEDGRTLGMLRASHLLQQLQGREESLPILLVPGFSSPALVAWTRACCPDLILSSEQTHYDLLIKSRAIDRRQTGFFHLNVHPAAEQGGVDQGHDRVGEHAAGQLHLKLTQRETGIPHPRELLLIDGRWQEGRGVWRLPTRPGRAVAR